MKVVIFKGGLGNQLFQYTMYCWLKERFLHVKALDFCVEHNGLELDKWFDVEIEFCNKIFGPFFGLVIRLPQWIRNKIITERFHYHEDGLVLYFNDYWQSKRFFPSGKWVRFKNLPLNEKNMATINKIVDTNSVALHVRRGDYLQSGNATLFTNLCQTDYYGKAVDYICQHVENPHFYVFSNDIEWCRHNIPLKDCTYIDWNTGKSSIYDMYLMSKCKYVIMANSTFSFWGAYLNENANKVIYPEEWYNGFKDETLDIFPDEWIGM